MNDKNRKIYLTALAVLVPWVIAALAGPWAWMGFDHMCHLDATAQISLPYFLSHACAWR